MTGPYALSKDDSITSFKETNPTGKEVFLSSIVSFIYFTRARMRRGVSFLVDIGSNYCPDKLNDEGHFSGRRVYTAYSCYASSEPMGVPIQYTKSSLSEIAEIMEEDAKRALELVEDTDRFAACYEETMRNKYVERAYGEE